MIITLIRTIIMYFFVVVTIRIMGKRQIGELEPSELVVTIIISEVASMPIQDPGQPVITSVVAIVILLVLEVILSYIAYKNPFTRKLLYGKPSIFFAKGRLNKKEMESQRFNINDLMETLRNCGVVSLNEVDYVIMETNGNISVLTNAENKAVTNGDMGIKSEEVLISYIIIDRGKIYRKNMDYIGLDNKWLQGELEKRDIKSASEVFYMAADENGKSVVIRKDSDVAN